MMNLLTHLDTKLAVDFGLVMKIYFWKGMEVHYVQVTAFGKSYKRRGNDWK